jgi:bifunctional non-homologous end joining protein LigD
MKLNKYRTKRRFDETPEPKGGKVGSRSLRFVVQKHDASHLHYDFRLEMDGVLKSWAVPKGPSLNPSEKRLAMMVEDHPYDYRKFEGIIPEGNYGAGAVIIWDEGTYEPIEPVRGKQAKEKTLLQQLKNGSLKFKLKGKKLQGEFALVKTKGMGDNAWLLIKHNDEFAQKADVTRLQKSVKSGKTIDSMLSEGSKKKIKRSAVKKSTANPSAKSTGKMEQNTEGNILDDKVSDNLSATEIKKLLAAAPKITFPNSLKPMLATSVEKAFDDSDWLFEVKWDGYRALAFMNKQKVLLQSRNEHSYNQKFHPIYEALQAWNIDAVVDGEIVAVNAQDKPDFGKLQRWQSLEEGPLYYYVFDLLWLHGKDLRTLPLTQRQALLKAHIPPKGPIRMGISVAEKGIEFFNAIQQMGLEGLVAKRKDSTYLAAERSYDWLKIKAQRRQEVVIAGYTHKEGSPKLFSALLLGYYQEGTLQFAGKVGTGFKDKDQLDLLQKFKKLQRKTAPFKVMPNYQKGNKYTGTPPDTKVTWLKPELVCEIHFTEITEDGVFRHPAFIGLREDKAAKDVVREDAIENIKINKQQAKKPSPIKPRRSNNSSHSGTFTTAAAKQVVVVNNVEVPLTNLDKIYWPKEGFTKRDLIEYYHRMASYILPYLKNRPQSLNRFPNGIQGKSFYQKDVTGKIPDWIDTYPYVSQDDQKQKHYMLGNNEASLLYMANAGAIEMNPWSSTILNPNHPTWCILDIDPDKDNSFDQVIETALAIKDLLDEIKARGYCKTSGSTGMHIYIPLAGQYEYDQSQLLAQWIASEVAQQLPFTSIERLTKKRKGKIYIDYLQNRATATLAAPYSVRPKPLATVSMPLDWTEVRKGLLMSDFTIDNALSRVQERGDLFKPVLGKGVNLQKILAKI